MMPELMNKYTGLFCPKVLALVLGLTLSLVQLSGISTGDYRTKWGGTWETVSLWQTYNGTAWVDATALPPTPFSNTITSSHYISLNSPFNLVGSGQVIINNQLQVRSGCTLEIGSYASLAFKELRVTATGVIVNNGTMTANNNNSSITIEANGTLINNSTIDTSQSNSLSFNLLSAGNLEFGKDGELTGQGSLTVGWNANIYIANPGGVDSSIALSGNKTYDRANITFNGETPQITGFSMPANVLNVVVANPAGLILSSSVNVVEEFVVNSGASLELGLSIIDKAWYGAGSFTLSSNAGITTAHPEGISSTGNTGSILVTIRRFDSYADYSFNGTTPQQTGNFVTEPDNNPEDGKVPIANLNISNPFGVTVTNPLAVASNVTVLEGTAEGSVIIVGQESKIDGLFSHNYYHSFAPNGILISNYIPYTDVSSGKPQAIKRRWDISGTFIGSKQVTFYWEPEDDNGINWSLQTPVVYHGNLALPAEAWDTNSSPRWVTTTITDLADRGMFSISGSGDGTLPVELSSFNAIPTLNNGVRLQWTTQSESGVNGYYIWRAFSANLADARMVSLLISATNTSIGGNYLFTDSDAPNGFEYWYWLQSVDYDGRASYYGPVHVKLEAVGGAPSVPFSTQLLAPYPNPFNPSVNIAYSLAKAADAQINIYNQKGQLVRKLFDGNSKAGRNTLVWNGDDANGKACGSGHYLIIMETGGQRFVQKASLVK
ncbi:MAG: FlgD immunoglobulin-like domain containing protein [Candidatus Cloacimonas sp.]|jgi:hypothetical protein|nr:FlgD immunoglobulin-like domain containing protein [Candidatus Cloacimonas sp.]